MLSNKALKHFANYIQQELGIVYSEEIYYQLSQRLEKVAEFLQIKDVDTLYSEVLKNGFGGDLKAYLLDIATNNETSFFRDPSIYRALEGFILPELKASFPTSFTHRIWSAASSFGQEPYSIAMVASEYKERHPDSPRIEIVASDISDQALKRAKSATYTQLEVQRGLSAQRMIKYFTKIEESYWRLKPEVSSLVSFSKQNLLSPFTGLGKFHVIFCRYVLIYQTAERKKEIMGRLMDCLHPKGFMILGGSESAMGLSQEIEQVSSQGAVFYRKRA